MDNSVETQKIFTNEPVRCACSVIKDTGKEIISYAAPKKQAQKVDEGHMKSLGSSIFGY